VRVCAVTTSPRDLSARGTIRGRLTLDSSLPSASLITGGMAGWVQLSGQLLSPVAAPHSKFSLAGVVIAGRG
jgi:hypothetical protein